MDRRIVASRLATGVLMACSLSTPAVAQMTLEKSVERLVLQQEIARVISQYSFTWDSKDASGWAELFTENGIFESPKRFEIKGRSALLNYAEKRFSTILADRQSRHYQTNTVFVDIADNVVRSRTVFVVVHILSADKSMKVVGAGTYEDQFHRTPAGWKIGHRIIRNDAT